MKKNSRRNFIRNSTGFLAGGIFNFNMLHERANLTLKPGRNKLLTRKLGKTGIEVPVVSMGVMNADNPNLVKEAWNRGIRHFDTAWYYQRGNNERMIGKALKELKVNREDVIIATKILLGNGAQDVPEGREAKELFLERFQESLDRLQMDYIDILYYHSVFTLEQINNPYILEAFTELKEGGKIKATGFSSHANWPDLVKDATDKGFYDVLLLSYNYSMHQNEESLAALQYAHEKGVGLIAMKTQCQQSWYKSVLPADMQKFYEGKIMHTALLKWVMQHEMFATSVPGFTTFQQLDEDMQVAISLDYTEEEKEFLTNQQVLAAIDSNCRFCGKCVPSCPNTVDIPSLMRIHMYAASYGNVFMAGITNKEIPAGKGLDACAVCRECVAGCVNSVPLASRIEELKYQVI
ncbi:MAG: aldo/keto reductase [Bacteroidales bacterium]